MVVIWWPYRKRIHVRGFTPRIRKAHSCTSSSVVIISCVALFKMSLASSAPSTYLQMTPASSGDSLLLMTNNGMTRCWCFTAVDYGPCLMSEITACPPKTFACQMKGWTSQDHHLVATSSASFSTFIKFSWVLTFICVRLLCIPIMLYFPPNVVHILTKKTPMDIYI